jgi:aspartate aminotransferase-like enzyme
MESSIVCLTKPGARGLVISHGKFGDRFVEIASARGRACEVLRVPEPEWGAAITPQQVADFLEADARGVAANQEPISFFCFQQNETSSGVTYYQPTIRELVKAARAYNPNIMVIVDAISGALAHLLDFDTLDVDILFLGSQKALGVSSGLAFAVLSERARNSMLLGAGFASSFDEFCDHPARESYLDSFDRNQRVSSISLLRALVASRRRESLDTPSLFHLLSTARALDLFDQEGGRIAVAERHAALAEQAREGVSRLGLTTMAQAPFDSNSVTVALLPDGVSASAVRKAMARETAIAVAGAQGDYWKARMIRIGTLGFVSASDLTRCLRALGTALEAQEASTAAKVQEVH